MVLKQITTKSHPSRFSEDQIAFPVSRLEHEVFKATGHRIRDYFKLAEGELAKFLSRRPGMFQVIYSSRDSHSSPTVLPRDFDVVSEFRLNEIP